MRVLIRLKTYKFKHFDFHMSLQRTINFCLTKFCMRKRNKRLQFGHTIKFIFKSFHWIAHTCDIFKGSQRKPVSIRSFVVFFGFRHVSWSWIKRWLFLANFYSSEQIFPSVSVFVSKNQIKRQSLLFYVDLPHTNFIRIGHVGGWVNRFSVLWDSTNQYVVAVFSKVEHSPHKNNIFIT